MSILKVPEVSPRKSILSRMNAELTYEQDDSIHSPLNRDLNNFFSANGSEVTSPTRHGLLSYASRFLSPQRNRKKNNIEYKLKIFLLDPSILNPENVKLW